MNKADKAKVLADEMRLTEPGMASALFGVMVMLVASALLAIAIYGLMSAVSLMARDPLIGERPYAPAYALTSLEGACET